MATTTPRISLYKATGLENYGRETDLNNNWDKVDDATRYNQNETLTGDWDVENALPNFTLHNTTNEDADGGRESELRFKGNQSGGEETTLGLFQFAHDGAADDEKGKFTLKLNDGSDGDTPTPVLAVDSAGRGGGGANVFVLPFTVWGNPLVENDLEAIVQFANKTAAYNANPKAGILFGNKYNAVGDIAGMGGIQAGKENATDGNLQSYLSFHTRAGASPAATEQARITSSGSILINTMTDARKLTVLDASDPQIRGTHTDGTHYFELQADGSGYLNIITSGGRVGIDAASPTAGLQMGNDRLIAVDVNAGLTASTNRTQGQGALTAQVNEIATCANNDDTVTLPTATAGLEIEIINNGAETLQIFPASGDNLGTGADTATELETNESVQYVAYDDTNWSKEATTEIIHAEAHDEDNTDAFVINDAGADFHAYHTNGFVAGDLAGWTFDAGGGGTSHAITGVADGTPSGTDISVTTGTSHGLAVGDIVSQTNLADPAYVGIFVVNDITSPTVYEVTASYTNTDTGTMDQAATLDVNTGLAGSYYVSWWASGTSVGSNETYDFVLCKSAAIATGTKVRRKFGPANDFGSFSGGGIMDIADGDKVSFALSNEDSAGNIIIRNLTIALLRL